MPILQPNHVLVNETLGEDGVSKVYIVQFHSDLGDVPNLVEALGAVNSTIVQLNDTSNESTKSQIVIDGIPSDVFDLINQGRIFIYFISLFR